MWSKYWKSILHVSILWKYLIHWFFSTLGTRCLKGWLTTLNYSLKYMNWLINLLVGFSKRSFQQRILCGFWYETIFSLYKELKSVSRISLWHQKDKKKASKTKYFMDKIQKPPRQPENPVMLCPLSLHITPGGMSYETNVTSGKVLPQCLLNISNYQDRENGGDTRKNQAQSPKVVGFPY